MTNATRMEDLVRLNAAYKAITGEDMYLTAAAPGDGKGKRYMFVNGTVVGMGKAETFMLWALDQVQNGKAHGEVAMADIRKIG